MEKRNIIHELERINKEKTVSNGNKVGQQQFYDMLLSRELSWQDIIRDLILTSQLDPWDINLSVLATNYLQKLNELEEANFIISSKVLLAASILLRIKSEILLNKYVKSLDEILFGKPESKYKPLQRMDIEDLPGLFPKTPLPRLRKVTVNELIEALERAMNTEHRRIKKEIMFKQGERNAALTLPRTKGNIRDKIRQIYGKIKDFFKINKDKRLSYTELAGEKKEEKISAFLPTLHLSNQERIFLEQERHFEEIYIKVNHDFKRTEIIREKEEQEEKIIINESLEEEAEKMIEQELKDRQKSASEILEDVNEKIQEDKSDGRAILN
jgi:segregation and condensation protein A